MTIRWLPLLWLSLLPACRTNVTPEQQVNDVKIVADIKSRFASDIGLSTLPDISVNSTNGVVTLSGQVDSAATRAKAEAIARSVANVVRVVNNIQVAQRPAARRAAPEPSLGLIFNRRDAEAQSFCRLISAFSATLEPHPPVRTAAFRGSGARKGNAPSSIDTALPRRLGVSVEPASSRPCRHPAGIRAAQPIPARSQDGLLEKSSPTRPGCPVICSAVI